MKIIIYSETNAATIQTNIGKPEYSYYYVLKSFVPMLQRFAEVVTVTRPESEVDAVYDCCMADNEICYFLSFSPPHRTITTLRCPTIAVFAWEFDDMPDQKWGSEPRSDWRYVLSRISGAIVHSSYTEQVVKQTMGENYPVITVPSPLWDSKSAASRYMVPTGQAELHFSGWLFDTQSSLWKEFQNHLDWDRKSDGVMLAALAESPVHTDCVTMKGPDSVRPVDIIKRHCCNWLQELKEHFSPPNSPALSQVAVASETHAPEYFLDSTSALLHSPQHHLVLEGVVYTTVLNPCDGRKNLALLVREFCDALRHQPRATLVIKSTHFQPDFAIAKVMAELLRQPDFQCRIVVISGYLDDQSYTNLLQATTFALNASYGEGQCLPLMEYMTRGVPAVSPDHTALADYISNENAFVVSHYREPACWPHDPRQVLGTFKHQIKTSSLRRCYEESFDVASDNSRYYAMSAAATKAAEAYCSIDLLESKLKAFLESEQLKTITELERRRKQVFGTLQVEAVDCSKVKRTDEIIAGWFLKETAEIIRGVPITGGDVVLDVGFGTGEEAKFCAERAARVIFSSPDAKKVAQVRTELEACGLCQKVEGIVADSMLLPLESGSVTKILALEMLQQVQDPAHTIRELFRVGAEGAQYVLTAPAVEAEQVAVQTAPASYFGPDHHRRIFSRDDLISLVEDVGLIVEDYRQDGFYWSLWLSLYWASQRAEGNELKGETLEFTSPPYDEILECWAKTWSILLAMPEGEKLKNVLDGVLPRRQVVIARKP